MNTTGLTDLEVIVLKAARHTDYGDCLENGQWSFSVCDAAKLDPKVYRGVASSLIKKGLVYVWNDVDPGYKNNLNNVLWDEAVFEYTDKGKELFNEKP